MKTVNHNIFKYIFVVVIIGLIIGSVYILYYKNTREEELVTKMLEDYNPALVTEVSHINEIKL